MRSSGGTQIGIPTCISDVPELSGKTSIPLKDLLQDLVSGRNKASNEGETGISTDLSDDIVAVHETLGGIV